MRASLLSFCIFALFLKVACCATILGKLAGDRQIFVEVDITPATFSEAFVVLHVDGHRVGVLCPSFYPSNCAEATSGDSRVSVASAYILLETPVPADAWNHATHMVYATTESYFGRHIAFASGSVSMSDSNDPGKFPSFIEAGDDNSKIMNIVIFSKDRPSQLDLLSRSLKRCVDVLIRSCDLPT
jgi:hypothetical protein